MALKQSAVTQYQKIKLKEIEWLADASETWTIAACWHIPNAMKRHYSGQAITNAFYGGYTDYWFSKQLNRYFKNVDRKIFKTVHRKRNLRLQRILTLEYKDSVGWHAHGLVNCAPRFSNEETAKILEEEWMRHTKNFANKKFDEHLIYLAPDNGTYLGYMTKNIDWLNEHANGYLDLNTYLSNN
jgi:hypothetical protein